MRARRRLLLLNVRDHLYMRDGYGCLDTTAGTGVGMSGYLDTGPTHLGLALSGFPVAGFLAAGAMSISTDIGVRANI